jgi:serine/threonine protein kinase
MGPGVARRRSRLEPGKRISDRYELSAQIASGGMGTIWRARHLQLEVDVAVKFMDPTLTGSPELRARFEREAKAAARLKTRHVARVLDHGVDDTHPYIVLELLDGEDLRAVLTRRGQLSIPEVVELVDQLARGLTAAHDAGIIHRDLKPSNVFLIREDDDLVVKLLDFGVAKTPSFGASSEHRTSTGVIVGSPNYMSPEQARSPRDIDHRSDLWSLGVIAYRCLSGKQPFAGDNPTDVLLRICKGPIPPPSAFAPELSAELDAFFARALDRDPDARFPTARAFAEALREALVERPQYDPLEGSLDATTHLPTLELDGPADTMPLESSRPSTSFATGSTAPSFPPPLPASPGVETQPFEPHVEGSEATRARESTNEVSSVRARSVAEEPRPSFTSFASTGAGATLTPDPSIARASRGRTRLVIAGGILVGVVALLTGLSSSDGPSPTVAPSTAPTIATTPVPSSVPSASADVADAPPPASPSNLPDSTPLPLGPNSPTVREAAAPSSSTDRRSPSALPAKPSNQPNTNTLKEPEWGF